MLKKKQITYFKMAKRILFAKLGHKFVVVKKVWYMLPGQGQTAVVELWFVAGVPATVCGGDGFISTDQAQSYHQKHSPSSHMEGTTVALSTYNHL